MSYNDPSLEPKDLLPTSMAKHAHKNKLEEAVFKSTKSNSLPAKPKHERAIIMETWNTNTSGHVFAELFKRSLGGKEIVLFKTLIIVHKLMREGHPQCMEDLLNRKEYLESLYSTTTSTSTPWGPTNSGYLKFILDKLNFHRSHVDVVGSISLQLYKEKHRKFNSKNTLTLVADLLELQKSLQAFQATILQNSGLNECKLAAILPTIMESYAIYTMSEYFIKKLVENDIEQETVDKLIEQFYIQYPVVRTFYFNCGNIPYISKVFTVPLLPQTPPNWREIAKNPKTSEKSPMKKKTPREKKKDQSDESNSDNLPPVEILSSMPGITSSRGGNGSGSGINGSGFYPSGVFNPGPVNPGVYNPGSFSQSNFQTGFGNYGITGSGNYNPGNQLQFPMGGNVPNPFPMPGSIISSQGGVPSTSQPFVPQSTSQPFVPQSTSQPFVPQSTSQPFVQPFAPQGGMPSLSRPNLPVDNNPLIHSRESEARDNNLARIRELEAKIQSLESILREKKSDNEKLRKLLAERDRSLADSRNNLEQELNKQKNEFMKTNLAIKEDMEKKETRCKAEIKQLLKGQIDFEKESVDQHLQRFDDPLFMGNTSANGEDILKNTASLRNIYDQCLKSLSNEGDVVGYSRQLAETTVKLLDDTKGTISKIEAPEVKLQLGEGSRFVASEVSKLLGYAMQLAPQGKPDERQNQFLQTERNRFLQRLLHVEQGVANAQKSLHPTDNTSDLEGMAANALLNAVKTIQDAASALRTEQQRRVIKVRQAGEQDVEGSIMDVVMGIATATEELVTAAAYAQHERMQQGYGEKKDNSQMYFRDPKWTEGLVSAGREVAEATREMIKFANKAAQGNIDDAALQAAARSVTSSAAALQQATHSKSSSGSKAVVAIDTATAEVSRTTKQLVTVVAQNFREEEDKKFNANTTTAHSIFDQQDLVSKLESQLEEARKKLFEARKEKYKGAGGISPRGNAPSIEQKPIPVYANASIDTSSHVSGWNNVGGEDPKVPSYLSKLEASLSKNLTITPSAQQQPQFNPFL